MWLNRNFTRVLKVANMKFKKKTPESGHTEISKEKLLKKATQKVQKQTPDKWPQRNFKKLLNMATPKFQTKKLLKWSNRNFGFGYTERNNQSN